MKLKVYKVSKSATLPTYGTQKSACFDIYADLKGVNTIKGYSLFNREITYNMGGTPSFMIQSGDRAMIPTGLIFDIPEGYSVRLHPRSGIALKHGLDLSNNEAVIDEDFVDPAFVLLRNNSMTSVCIEHGMRIAQGELVKDERCEIEETGEKPGLKSDRDGGFGSTGV